eukprot:TRINITY_DN802_c0_g1_i1.p1 TRINITY_DN802_c0_g1~~TRINITY_DN802_c0_g1_i1.p1  ORF type:complete len:248 (-),score=55.45 TRINITY_DN802_c0_g1_i1:281-1024(-)
MGMGSSKDLMFENIPPTAKDATTGESVPSSPRKKAHLNDSAIHDERQAQFLTSYDDFSQNGIPTVFNWAHGGRQVFVTGSFNNWKEKLPLNRSDKDFTLIQNLPAGQYQYKFIVDGKWKYDPDQPTVCDPLGNTNNLIEVKEYKGDAGTGTLMPGSGSPPGSYQIIMPSHDYAKEPPYLPPHLRSALLNSAPLSEDPTVLPLPHHVMLNHYYSLSSGVKDEREEVVVLSATQRCKSKYVTTIFYKAV